MHADASCVEKVDRATKFQAKSEQNEELNWNLVHKYCFMLIISYIYLLFRHYLRLYVYQFYLKNYNFCLQNQVDLKVELLVKRPHEILLLKIEFSKSIIFEEVN